MNVNISNEAMFKINHWVNKSPVEISGLGKVIREDNGDLLVTDVYLLEQENTSTETELDATAISKLMFQTKDVEGDLSFWWHSHVNMGVFWSSTDMQAIHQLGEYGYVVATVFNKKGEKRTAYYQGEKDTVPKIFIDDITTKQVFVHSSDLTAKLDEEFIAKCKQKVYVPTSYGNIGKSNLSIYDKDDKYFGNNPDYVWDEFENRYTFKKEKYTPPAKKGNQLNLLDYEDEELDELESRYVNKAYDVAGFMDGEINDYAPHLRYCQVTEKWIPYYEYAKKHNRRRTVIDKERDLWIDMCRDSYATDVIICDEDVEDFAISYGDHTDATFYTGKTWRD